MTITISDVGEKRMISEFVTPFFNPRFVDTGVGDDCGMIKTSNNEIWLFSTDRVPADLIAFRLEIIDFYGLGKYLAWLNISDIAACGGEPVALLLNLALPPDLNYEAFKELCRGCKDAAMAFNCEVIGGDLSSSSELSLSATSVGKITSHGALLRRGAQVGDHLFISKPIGLTPSAFAYHLRCDKGIFQLSTEEINILNEQFTTVMPLVDLGKRLLKSGKCTSCMDNTDGLGNSLEELSNASNKSFIIEKERLQLPEIVEKTAKYLGDDPIELAFSAGADFSLVGTIHKNVDLDEISTLFDGKIHIIGHVAEGTGIFLDTLGQKTPLKYSRWNYFTPEEK